MILLRFGFKRVCLHVFRPTCFQRRVPGGLRVGLECKGGYLVKAPAIFEPQTPDSLAADHHCMYMHAN